MDAVVGSFIFGVLAHGFQRSTMRTGDENLSRANIRQPRLCLAKSVIFNVQAFDENVNASGPIDGHV